MSATANRPKFSPLPLLLVVLTLGLLLFTCVTVLNLRFARGDLYPQYSTLRHDPLGASVFFESLKRLPGWQVTRDMQPLSTSESGKGDTLFMLGTSYWSLESLMQGLSFPGVEEGAPIVASGGRMVISFAPFRQNATAGATNNWDALTRGPHTNETTTLNMTNAPLPGSSIATWTSARIDLGPSTGSYPAFAQATPEARALGLPPELPVYTDLCLTNLNENWSVLYATSNRAMVAERRFAEGTLVLSTLSYVFSNEALRHARHPAFLAWATGRNKRVTFNEHHLGITPRDGIATLLRGYGLASAVLVLLALGVLFVWQHSMPLVVRTPEEQDAHRVSAGRSTHAGLVNLLIRSIPSREILPTCLAHWKKAQTRTSSLPDETAAAIDADIADLKSRKRIPGADLVATYNRIVQHLDALQHSKHRKENNGPDTTS